MVFRPISAVLIRHFPIFIPKSHISFYTIRGYPGRIAYSSRFMHLCVALCISYRPLSRRIHEKAFIKRTDHKTPATRAMAPKSPHADERDVCCPRRQYSSLRRTRLYTPAWRTRRRRPWPSGKPARAEPYGVRQARPKNLSDSPCALPVSMGISGRDVPLWWAIAGFWGILPISEQAFRASCSDPARSGRR